MAGSAVIVLLFGLAVASALPEPDTKISIPWPEERPSWWPSRLPWPPQWPENSPSIWPDSLPWPPALPEDAPVWWPDSLPWPPAKPDGWPDQPSWWPDLLPWPPAKPDGWPDQPSWWPDSLPWPPAKPEGWPDQPAWWPESLPWPPALPELAWPDQPAWWPDNLPWPPALPEITWPPPGVITDRIPYIPSRDNQFHLFTRSNPYISQPLVINNQGILSGTNYNPSLKTIVLIHDIYSSATDAANSVLVPAFLSAGNVNVIVVDWSAGAWSAPALSTFYSALSGNFISRFLNWLVEASNGDFEQFQLVGVGLGGWNAGFIGLRLKRQVGYITALDPAGGPEILRLVPPMSPNAAKYTEVVHTDAANSGYPKPLGHVDVYPNGGEQQPGCGGDSSCNRNRAVYFWAESIQSGGFTAIECENWRDAFSGNCHGPATLNMGGLEPKTGSRGVFFLRTNAVPPFSLG